MRRNSFGKISRKCQVILKQKGYKSMTTKTSDKNQATVIAQEAFTTGFVTSKDGVTIGYRQLGHGPGVVLLHGSMSSGHNHMQLAQGLADAFTVYIPDRRGRGLSGPYGKNYSIQEDVEDLEALLTKTGAHNVFGLSSGAVICLQAALTLPTIHKAAIFEPPFLTDPAAGAAILRRFDREIAQGKTAAALITGMKGAQMGPPVFNLIPRFLLELLVNMAMAQEDKKANNDYVPMRALAPTLHYDFQLVVELSGKLESFRAMPAEVLLLGGSKSPAYMKVALDALAKVLPHARRIEFPGLGHAASWNSDRGGHPEPVAQELRRFFAGS
jgi:pimeloyl-ACP methyl ester carboxylesterase